MTSTYLNRIMDPWNEFDRINRALSRRASDCGCEYPAVNVWVNGENALVTAEVPGADREDFDISVSGDTVTLSGKRPKEELREGEAYHRHEIRYGDFRKSIRLPFTVDAEKVHAVYKNGVLNVSLPQSESDKPRIIKINS